MYIFIPLNTFCNQWSEWKRLPSTIISQLIRLQQVSKKTTATQLQAALPEYLQYYDDVIKSNYA